MERDVFISYRSEDKVWADRLCAALEQQNVTCWIAPRDIRAGHEWAAAIVDALQHCKSFVVILSSNSLNARQISREAELADQQRLPIITFRVEDVQPPAGLLYFLGNLQWLDAFDNNFDSAARRLVDVVKGSPTQTMQVPVLPSAPARTIMAPPPPPASGTASRNLMLGIGAAVVVLLVLAGWFVFGRPKPVSTAGARVEVERFLDAVKASNYDEAWNQFTAEARAREPKPKRIRMWTQEVQKNGPLQSYQFNRCGRADAPNLVTCSFRLDYRDGPIEGRYVVARDAGGDWAISSAAHMEPQKAH